MANVKKTHAKKTISIVVPIYNEEKNIVSLIKHVEEHVKPLKNYSFNFIFVNDGSRDNSAHIIIDLTKKHKHIKFINLSRNFGKEIALTAGLDSVKSDAAIFMDADLQHPPAVIPALIEKWEQGALVVSTIRSSTEKESLCRKAGSYWFYKILNIFSDTKFMPKTTDFKLVDARVIELLKKFTERNRMFRGLIDWLGFETEFVEFKAPERASGEAGYSYRKLISLAIHSITSFSLFPLRIAGYIGLFITVCSSTLLIIMLIVKFIYKSTIFSSIAFVIVGNTILMGIVLTCLGLVALYIGQIHSEVINRPLYIVKQEYNINE